MQVKTNLTDHKVYALQSLAFLYNNKKNNILNITAFDKEDHIINAYESSVLEYWFYKNINGYQFPNGYKSVDIFVVGGGSGGAYGFGSTGEYGRHFYAVGGDGGCGGYTNTYRKIELPENRQISIILGGGGSGGYRTRGTTHPAQPGGTPSIIVNGQTYSAAGGTPGAGGSGGGVGGECPYFYGSGESNASYHESGQGASNGANGIGNWSRGSRTLGQGRTTRLFEELNGVLFGAAGGGGGAYASRRSYGSRWVNASGGGTVGGGSGGSPGYAGGNGYDFYGAGGGGGGGTNDSTWDQNYTPGGRGGCGIAIVRLYPGPYRPNPSTIKIKRIEVR